MPGNIKQKFGSAVDLTIVLASLADAANVLSSEVDNTSDLFNDVLVQLQVTTGASGVSSSGVVHVYAIGIIDSLEPGSPNVLLNPIGVINANVNATVFKSNVFSVANAFGGKMPPRWKLVVRNDTGAALDSTEGNHLKKMQGVYQQYT